MDYIKKVICIDGARTKTQGLMPYYAFGESYREHVADGCRDMDFLDLESAGDSPNGNWGGFVADPCFLAKKDKTYITMLHNYYSLLNMVRNGVKLRKVETKEGEIIFTEDVGAFELDGECFEGCEEPDFLYAYEAYDVKDFYSTDIESLREETKHIYRYTGKENIRGERPKFVVLIEDFDKFAGTPTTYKNGLDDYLDGTTYSDLGTGINVENADEHIKWSRYCQVVDFCIGKINIPASIYNKHIKVPKSMPCADVEEYIDLLENYDSISADCCNLRLYEDLGGKEFLNYLKNTARGECDAILRTLENRIDYKVPSISMSLLLHENYTDVGVLTNVDGVDYVGNKSNKERPHGIGADSGVKNKLEAICLGEIVMGTQTREFPTTEQYKANPTGRTPIEVESLLKTLRSPKKYSDDKNNVLPGLFMPFSNPAGEMFSCVKESDKVYYELRVSPYSYDDDAQPTQYCMKYEEASLSDSDIYGMNNFMTELPNFLQIYDTEEEANAALDEQRDNYATGDPGAEINEWVWRICVYDPVWTMYGPLGQEPKDAKNADGKMSWDEGIKYGPGDDYRNATGKFFRTITVPDSGIRIAQTQEEESGVNDPPGTHYFFFVKYNNSINVPMDIPYKEGNTANLYCILDENGKCTNRYRGDVLTKVAPSSNYIEFEYVIGGIFSLNDDGVYQGDVSGGDKYYEKYYLDTKHVDTVPLDGVDKVRVWSKYIDFDGAAKEFYSPRYNLYRTGNTANIISMTTGDNWKTKYAFDAFLTKEDFLTGFSLPPKVDVNVTIDRGGVSVFERHYKLAECNTMQDLQNYHNGEFFPD